MTLVIEDGTGIANANSYVNDATYVAYAAARGRTIGSDATAREIELILAMDYIESKRAQLKGVKTDFEQALQWPRHSVWIDDFQISSTSIPDELKNAQMEAAISANTLDLVPSGTTQDIQSEQVDVLKVSYFQGGSWETVRLDNVDIFLNVLLTNAGGGINANVIRA